MSTTPETPMDDDALAAEYVLRLMSDDERQAFEARLLDDAALRALVNTWEAHFAQLADEVSEVTPADHIKHKIMEQIEPSQYASRRWFRRWLPLGLAGVALVAFLAVMPFLRGPDFNPVYHASLASSDGVLQIEAGFAPDSNLFKVLRPQGDALPGRALELWVIAEGADAPISLGVLPDERELLFELDPALASLVRGSTLAVSDEPQGGSPTGAPTGEVLAAAAFFEI